MKLYCQLLLMFFYFSVAALQSWQNYCKVSIFPVVYMQKTQFIHTNCGSSSHL